MVVTQFLFIVNNTFIEHRRRGLSRFLNYVINHSVLSQDDEFEKFVTLDGTWNLYRSSKAFIYEEDYPGLDVVRKVVSTIPETFENFLVSFKALITTELESICNIIRFFEKEIKILEDGVEGMRNMAVLFTYFCIHVGILLKMLPAPAHIARFVIILNMKAVV